MGLFNSISKLINLANRENIEKQRYASRIKQILENSIDVINKSNNPKTVFSRYEVIRLRVKELLEKVPEAVKDLILNGRAIGVDNVDSVVDLAKNEWFVDYIKREGNQIAAMENKKVQIRKYKQLLKWMPDIPGAPIPTDIGEIKQRLLLLVAQEKKY